MCIYNEKAVSIEAIDLKMESIDRKVNLNNKKYLSQCRGFLKVG